MVVKRRRRRSAVLHTLINLAARVGVFVGLRAFGRSSIWSVVVCNALGFFTLRPSALPLLQAAQAGEKTCKGIEILWITALAFLVQTNNCQYFPPYVSIVDLHLLPQLTLIHKDFSCPCAVYPPCPVSTSTSFFYGPLAWSSNGEDWNVSHSYPFCIFAADDRDNN